MRALRIGGDDPDHEHEPPVSHANCGHSLSYRLEQAWMTCGRVMSLIAMALLWTENQIHMYLYGIVCLRSQLLLLFHVLANSGFQRLRPRSGPT